MKYKLVIFRCIFFLYCSNTGLAQPPYKPSAGLSFQNFNLEDGLSDNFINHIYQDSRGFIWISTPEGLNRFDGSTFKKYYAGKKPGNLIPLNMVGALYEYKKDHLLIATNNGLVIMNTIDQEFYQPKDSILAAAAVFNFSIENNNKIWLCLGNGLVQIDSTLAIKKNIRKIPEIHSIINAVHRLIDGRLLLSTADGYYFLNEENNSVTSLTNVIKEADNLKEIFISYYDKPTNSIYFNVWGKGLHIVDLNNNKIRNVLGLGNITCVTRNSRGNIWLGGRSGLSFYDEKNTRYITYNHHADENSSLSNNSVSFLFEDREKNLWIGTTEGLSKLSNSALSLTYYKNEFEINGSKAEIFDITKGEDGKIYIATYGNGVFSIDSFQHIKSHGRDLIKMAWSVNKDGQDIIVTGHEKKMYRLHTSSGKTELVDMLNPYRDTGDLVLFAYTDHHGGKWYSINNQMGLFYYKQGEKEFKHFSNKQEEPPFPHSYFNIVAEDQSERIWFGMNKRSEFVSYDFNTAKFSSHKLADKLGIALAGVNCLLADKNIIWVGTDGTGLIRYDPVLQATRLFTIEDGLSANNISSLVFDKHHRLWAGTRKGMNCLLPGQQRFINFTLSDGFPETYFIDNAMYYDSAQNRLYAAAKTTLISFDPDEFLKSAAQAKPLLIEEILINGKIISFSSLKELKLPYDQNNIQFIFTAIDFENPGSISYYYKLKGADNDWIESGHQHSASYANLTDGKYRFLVKAIKPGSKIEMVAEVPFDIIIDPPYWKTWWLRALVIFAITSMLYALIRAYYLRKLEHQRLAFESQQAIEKERTRIATDMHDDLGAGLTRIKFLSETIGIKKLKQEPIEEEIASIREYSHEMIDKMGEIVWALNEKNDSLSDLLSFTRAYAVEYISQNGIRCTVETPDEFPSAFVSGEFRRNIYLVLKEALHNIVKHAAANTVFLRFSISHGLQITIQDDGRGFNDENIRPFSNGLANMQKRMKDLGGSFAIESSNGTTIKLSAPLPSL